MKMLLVFATGGRPVTALTMRQSLVLALKERPDVEVTEVRWHDDGEHAMTVPGWNVIEKPGTHPGEAYNLALADYSQRHGEVPGRLVTMDDDVVMGEQTLDRLSAILDADKGIGVIGAWNDLSERGRGALMAVSHKLGEDLIQDDGAGKPFCVGGALMMITRRAAMRIMLKDPDGQLYPNVLRRDDEAVTARCRLLGMRACLAITVPVALLPDDEVNDWYRPRILAQHFGGIDDKPGV